MFGQKQKLSVTHHEIAAVVAVIPQAFAEVVDSPALSDAKKQELVETLVRYQQRARISEEDIASAPPEVRKALEAMKQDKDLKAKQEAELMKMLLGPFMAGATVIGGAEVISQEKFGLLSPLFAGNDLRHGKGRG